jgi:hypothetical protein
MMPKSVIVDRFGNILEDATIVPPGGRIVVDCRFMDSLSDQTRRAFGLGDQAVRDCQGFLVGHRPSFAAAAAADYKARDAYVQRVRDAWKNPSTEQPTPASPPGPRTQNADTAYRAYVDRISNAWRCR